VHTTVREPPGASTSAATATRGSSRTRIGFLLPWNRIGTRTGTAGSRITCHDVTGSLLSSAIP